MVRAFVDCVASSQSLAMASGNAKKRCRACALSFFFSLFRHLHFNVVQISFAQASKQEVDRTCLQTSIQYITTDRGRRYSTLADSTSAASRNRTVSGYIL